MADREVWLRGPIDGIPALLQPVWWRGNSQVGRECDR